MRPSFNRLRQGRKLLQRRSGRRAAVLGRPGAGGGASECSGSFSSAWRWSERAVDVGGLLQRRPETVRVLEVATVLERHGAELLEVRWCSGSNLEGLERTGAQ